MRKGRDGEQNKTKQNKTKENNDGNSGPLTSLPVGLQKVDRLQRRRSCQKRKRVYNPVYTTGPVQPNLKTKLTQLNLYNHS